MCTCVGGGGTQQHNATYSPRNGHNVCCLWKVLQQMRLVCVGDTSNNGNQQSNKLQERNKKERESARG